MMDLETVKNLPGYQAACATLPQRLHGLFEGYTLRKIIIALGDQLTPAKFTVVIEAYLTGLSALDFIDPCDFTCDIFPAMAEALGQKLAPDTLMPLLKQFTTMLAAIPETAEADVLSAVFPAMLLNCGAEWLDEHGIDFTRQFWEHLTPLEYYEQNHFILHIFPLIAQTLKSSLTPEIIVKFIKIFSDYVARFSNYDEGMHSFLTFITALGPEMATADMDFFMEEKARLGSRNFFHAICEVAIARNEPLTKTQYAFIKNMLHPLFKIPPADDNRQLHFATPFGFEFEFDSTNPRHDIGHLSKAEASPPPFYNYGDAALYWWRVEQVVAYMNVGLLGPGSKHSEFLTCHLNIGLTESQATQFASAFKLLIIDILDLDTAPDIPLERLLAAHTPRTYLNYNRCQLRTDEIIEVRNRQIKYRIEYKADAIAAHGTPLENRIQRAQFAGWLLQGLAENKMTGSQVEQIRDIMRLIHLRHGGSDFTQWYTKFSDPDLFKERQLDETGQSQEGFKNPLDQQIFDDLERGHRRRGPIIGAALRKFKTALMEPDADVQLILTRYQARLRNDIDDTGPQIARPDFAQRYRQLQLSM